MGHRIEVARTPDPPGVTSNLGHPSEPVVIALATDDAGHVCPVVAIAEGSGHLGSSGDVPVADLLTASGALAALWAPVFARASATWLVDLLARLAAREALVESDVVQAYVAQHGTAPAVSSS